MISIRNKAITTLQNCEDEPIHIPGAIQSHGFLVGISKKDRTISYCSQNLEHWCAFTPASVLAGPYSVLPDTLPQAIDKYFDTGFKEPPPRHIHIDEQTFDVFITSVDAFVIVECLQAMESELIGYAVFNQTADLIHRLQSDLDLIGLCNLVAQRIQAITGYHRVMVYRFDEACNGEVIAEAVTEGVPGFLGLHYPSTDIPAQARALYLKNLMRMIADVDSEEVPLVTHSRELADAGQLDLSTVKIRAVSPIHIQYLKNMGVKATLTISLICDNKLWGLIACHHLEKRSLPYSLQLQAFVQAQILGSQFNVQRTAENYRISKRLTPTLNHLLEQLSHTADFLTGFEMNADILKVANASGAAFLSGNALYTQGVLPDHADLKELFDWLIHQNTNQYMTDQLSVDHNRAATYSKEVAGIYYRRIRAGKEWGHLVFMRQSVNEEVWWAGNPMGKGTTTADRLSPRHSFEAWREIKDKNSKKWEEPETDAAAQFAYGLEQHLLQHYLRSEEQKQRQLNEQLKAANDELENIHWISSHDLKEPLRKIQVFASMINNPGNADSLEKARIAVERIQASAIRMQHLLDSLLNYSRMLHAEQLLSPVDLNKVLAEARVNFEDEQELVSITSEALPEVKGNFFQLQQLFINLIGNSIKFRKEQQQATIHLSCKMVQKEFPRQPGSDWWYKIIFRDQGIGFEPYLAEKIFEIFKRGHNRDQAEGTGVGLAICKKIMEIHGGHIRAESILSEGATFYLYFPQSSME